jgi:hypothetical protein
VTASASISIPGLRQLRQNCQQISASICCRTGDIRQHICCLGPDLVCRLIWLALVGLLQSRVSLEVEILALRHQLNVLWRKSPKKPTFTIIDRLVFAGLYRLAPGMLDALAIVEPQTVICWHRAGFRAYWRWKSKPRGGRPKTLLEIRHLIRDISLANPLWGGSPDSRRTPQARHRRRPNLGRQAYGKAQKASIPRLEDFPP